MSQTTHPLLFVGQAPPRVVVPVPFGRTRLYAWFESVGVSQEELLAASVSTALVSHFPGKARTGDKPPTLAHIAAERERILTLVRTLQPRTIVPVGTLSIREFLRDPTARLENVVGRQFRVKVLDDQSPFLVIPLPHPSGASPWVHLGDNGELLAKALLAIRDQLRRDYSSQN